MSAIQWRIEINIFLHFQINSIRLMNWRYFYILHIIHDPINKEACLCVDTWITRSTSIPPGHQTIQTCATHQSWSRSSLTEVETTVRWSIITSAHHRVNNRYLTIRIPAVIITHHWNINLPQVSPTLHHLSWPPATDCAPLIIIILLTRCWQLNSTNVITGEVSLSSKMKQTDVVDGGPSGIIFMKNNSRNCNVFSTFIIVQIDCSNSNTQTLRCLSINVINDWWSMYLMISPLTTVTHSEDSVRSQEWSWTHEVSSSHHCHAPGELSRFSCLCSTRNIVWWSWEELGGETVTSRDKVN